MKITERIATAISNSCDRHGIDLREAEIDLIAEDLLWDGVVDNTTTIDELEQGAVFKWGEKEYIKLDAISAGCLCLAKKERIIPEGEPIKDIGAEGALGKEGKTSCDVGEYKSRFEIADKVLTETRAKLAKAEHDRDRYKAKAEKIAGNPYKRVSDADNLKAKIKHLNTIVERLDELLAKGKDEYIMGIDGVEGLKDMWERSAVRAFAKKVKAKSYVNARCTKVVEIEKIDELLKEY